MKLDEKDLFNIIENVINNNLTDDTKEINETNFQLDPKDPKLDQKVKDIKDNTWDSIMFYTNTSLSRMIKKLYDSKGVYQIGIEIYDNSSNLKLAEIREVTAYTDESKYLLKNKEYARITKTKRDFLEVFKSGTYTIFDEDDIDLSEDQNLYNRYVAALNLIKP